MDRCFRGGRNPAGTNFPNPAAHLIHGTLVVWQKLPPAWNSTSVPFQVILHPLEIVLTPLEWWSSLTHRPPSLHHPHGLSPPARCLRGHLWLAPLVQLAAGPTGQRQPRSALPRSGVSNPFWKAPGQWDWPPCLCETNFPVQRTAYLLLLVLHLPLEGFSLTELPCSPSETPWGLPFQGLSAASEFHLASPCRLQHRCTAGSGTCLPPNVAWPPRQSRSSRLVMVAVSCAELPAWRLETWRKRPGLLLATRHLHPGRS